MTELTPETLRVLAARQTYGEPDGPPLRAALVAHAAAWEADRRRLAEVADMRIMGLADTIARGNGHDYSLAAYTLRDLATTKRADLYDLCDSMSDGGASKGDWDGLREWWWKAALANSGGEEKP